MIRIKPQCLEKSYIWGLKSIIMENKSNPLLSQSLMYGLFLALVGIIISILFWMLNVIPKSTGAGLLIGLLNLAIDFFLLYYFTKRYRDDSMGGYISYGQAFLFAFLVVIFAAVISTVYSYIFNAFIDPGYMERVMNVTVTNIEQKMSARGLSAEQIDQIVARMEHRMSRTPLKIALSSLPASIIVSTIIALITSAIVKKSQEIPVDN
jgi:hypothetical protein